MNMIKKMWKGITSQLSKATDLMDKHDFSLLWSNIIFCSSIALILNDIPPIIRETLPYNGVLIGGLGVSIALLKYIGISYKHFIFHSVVDFMGASWLIFMGLITTTAVPPMMFTGVILFVAGIMVDLRLFQRAKRR